MTYSAGVKSVATRKGDVVLTVADVAGAISQTQLNSALSGLAVSAGNVASVEYAKTGVQFTETLVAGDKQAFLAYQITDPNDLSDALLLSIDFRDVTGIGSKFTWEIFEYNPLTNLQTANHITSGLDAVVTGSGTYATEYKFAATAYISNAAARNGLYLVITNILTSPITIGFKLDFLKLPPVSNPITLPGFTGTEFTYTGPSGLTSVEVGPGQTFPEPADAIPYLADGFVMNIHPGTYYKPFAVVTSAWGAQDGTPGPYFTNCTIQAAAGANADTVKFNGRGGWVTGYPLWPDNSPPGGGPTNPYRLNHGKAFLRIGGVAATVNKIGFWYCGGGYGHSVLHLGSELNTGDGEAGIYLEGFTGQQTVTVNRCTFDGNENGIFFNALEVNGNLVVQYCDFSAVVPNGLSVDGLSHNVYIAGGHSLLCDHCNFFDCNGNSFKSRCAIVTITNSFLMQGVGRAIDYPDGGTLTVTNCVFSQKSYAGSGNTRVHNFVGVNNENHNHGSGTAAFTNCTAHIAYSAMFLTHYSPTITWSGTTQNWYDGGGKLDAYFDYDTEHGSDVGTVTGDLVFSPNINTVWITGWPPRNTTLYHLQ